MAQFSTFEMKGPDNSFDLIPDGWYEALIKDAKVGETQSGGEAVSFCFEILGPTHAGRVVWYNYNVRNKNETAERIGQQQLSDLARAIGFDVMPDDTDAFLNQILQIKIEKEKKPREGYDPRNVIAARGYKPAEVSDSPIVDDIPAAAPRASEPVARPQAQAQPAVPVWKMRQQQMQNK